MIDLARDPQELGDRQRLIDDVIAEQASHPFPRLTLMTVAGVYTGIAQSRTGSIITLGEATYYSQAAPRTGMRFHQVYVFLDQVIGASREAGAE